MLVLIIFSKGIKRLWLSFKLICHMQEREKSFQVNKLGFLAKFWVGEALRYAPVEVHYAPIYSLCAFFYWVLRSYSGALHVFRMHDHSTNPARAATCWVVQVCIEDRPTTCRSRPALCFSHAEGAWFPTTGHSMLHSCACRLCPEDPTPHCAMHLGVQRLPDTSSRGHSMLHRATHREFSSLTQHLRVEAARCYTTHVLGRTDSADTSCRVDPTHLCYNPVLRFQPEDSSKLFQAPKLLKAFTILC